MCFGEYLYVLDMRTSATENVLVSLRHSVLCSQLLRSNQYSVMTDLFRESNDYQCQCMNGELTMDGSYFILTFLEAI